MGFIPDDEINGYCWDLLYGPGLASLGMPEYPVLQSLLVQPQEFRTRLGLSLLT